MVAGTGQLQQHLSFGDGIDDLIPGFGRDEDLTLPLVPAGGGTDGRDLEPGLGQAVCISRLEQCAWLEREQRASQLRGTPGLCVTGARATSEVWPFSWTP